MATLSKNGFEIARYDQLRISYSIRSNGKILKNEGFGWKLVKLKEGISTAAFHERLERIEIKLSPVFLQYRKAVQNEFPLSVRWQYLTLRDLLGSDIDGIWADLDDRGIHTDVETLRELHHLYEAVKLSKQANSSSDPTSI